MCGICGIVDWTGKQIESSRLVAMRDLMTARGPDDAGLYLERGVGLGHRRLSIIDLSAAARQPMANEDGTIQLVYNGEIYNFLDLRKELLAGGHRFVSRSDTEVLVHGYEQWGIDGLVARLEGMFAFAIWDGGRRQLHLVRDRLGKKPLFYRQTAGRCVFASDIKSIYLEADGRLAPDERAVDEFLYYTVISQPRTIFADVRKLPAGHVATFQESGGTVKSYWQPDFTAKAAKSVDQWLEGIDWHLHRAVKRRLISDVPIGAFLSGGVDSSCVCAVMAQEASVTPRTFSVGFADAPDWDERRYAQAVARHIGSDHAELLVDPDVAPILAQLVWQHGEPYGDSSMVPTFLIAREARKHVTVVLTGDGGDEAFAGYSRHLRSALPERYAYLPGLVTGWLIPAASRLLAAMAGRTTLAHNFQLAADYLSGRREALAYSTCWFDAWRRELYSDDYMARLGGWHPLETRRPLLNMLAGPTSLDRALEYLMRTTLCDDYLTKVDVATMANSLEARCPFLDAELLTFAMTIPSELLVMGWQKKALLKRYAQHLIPQEVIYRKKQGFAVPIRRWFQNEWRLPLERFLLSKQACQRGYFRPSTVQRVLQEHAAGRRNHAGRIWTLLVFEIWNRLFVDRTLTAADPVLT
jgi:asparagine synthase (glutamine-hydrolysing)